MKKGLSIVLVLLSAGLTDSAHAQQTYSFNLVESPGAALLWPNQLHAINDPDVDSGLLGRVVTAWPGDMPVTSPNNPNACALAPSFPCGASSPPAFLMSTGAAEGPSGAGGANECNRATTACNTGSIPSSGHGGHLNGDSLGVYSFLALHTIPLCSDAPAGQHVSFLSGSYDFRQDPYVCNDCPPLGHGRRNGTTPTTLRGTGPAAEAEITAMSLWGTQIGLSFLGGSYASGHIRLGLDQSGPGKMSYCGTGTAHLSLLWDNCEDYQDPTPVDFGFPLRFSFRTYSLFALQGGPDGCEPADCYFQYVIVPAALSQNPDIVTLQTLHGTAVVPSDAHCFFSNATVDVLLYAASTERFDVDGDGTDDPSDPCPNDPADGCLSIPAVLGGGACPGGTIFCSNSAGVAGCFAPPLCSTRRDVDQSCFVGTSDVAAPTGVFGSQFFGTPFPVGPFEP